MRKYIPAILCAAVLLLIIAGAIATGDPASAAKGPPEAKDVATVGKPGQPDSLAEVVLIEAGKFTMGDDGGADDQRPAHEVKVSAFYMDRYEVTQRLYEKLMGVNPSKHIEPENPVERVTWQKAALFCNARSRAEGLAPCYDEKTFQCDFAAAGYRLPTEAEWEYACRAGSTNTYFFGPDPRNVGDYGWTLENSGGAPHPVGQKKPNPWGLHDILGNVWEWVNDPYDASYYASSESVDPKGPEKGWPGMRGGSWTDRAKACRSAQRKYNDDPDQTVVCANYDMYGFRCVRRAAEGSEKR